MAANYETVVTLPSNGRLYDGTIPDSVLMRAMTTQEEKMLYGSTSGNERLKSMIKACILEPADFDINGLVLADFQYLLFQMRIITYGPEYKIDTICPYCNHSNAMTINLAEDLLVSELPDDFVEPIPLTLPVSKDKIECKLLRLRDNNTVDKLAKKVAKNGRTSQNEVAFMYRLAKSIVSLNGNSIDFPEAQEYVQEMHARDSAYINYKLDQIELGYDTEVEIEACGQCGEAYEVNLPMTSEFFRPSFD